MSSTFIEHSPEADRDKSLILIMDGEGNVTADPVYFEKIINNQKLPEVGIKIVRLDSTQPENVNEDDAESKQELKLTVEEIYPENLALAPGEPAVSSPLEILPGPSNEHISHDIVDPFSQMDPEQLQRLERALASEQAKQILGENVAAMLDIHFTDSPAAFLQNSIKNDHCYTNLLPSSDPNGPSFFMNDVRAVNGETSKGKGKAKVGTPIKGRKIVPLNPVKAGGSVLKKGTVKDAPPAPRPLPPTKQSTMIDCGMPVGLPHLKPPDEVEDPTYEEDVDVEDSEGSAGVDDDNLSDEDYNNRSTRTRRRPRKNKKKLLVRKGTPLRPYGRPPGSGRPGKRSTTTPEVRARNEKLNDAMSKIVQWMDYDTKEDDGKTEMKPGPRKLKTYKAKTSKEETSSEGEKTVKEAPKPPEEPPSPAKSQQAKYPKRENRKPPAHLAEALGPALFSAPDMIRRISTGEEVPQTPPEKKNFTVGAHSNAKLAERAVVKTTPNKTENILKELVNHVKEKPKTPTTNEIPKVVKPARTENVEVSKAGGESRQIVVPKATSSTASSEVATVHKIANIEIQKIIEKQPIKPVLYEEDQDNSDDNIDENYYLDPTQMDQSLLEGFGQAATKSEDQLLQEAILLQEQLIEPNKDMELPEGANVVLENPGEMQFETETIEDIQNEITSAILVAKEEKNDQKKNFQFIQGTSSLKEMTKVVLESQSEMDEDALEGAEEGTLIVDENRPEDRRRNSAKRRRSDEVSDLDSDLDDALSEASWNSEDDPDRLWCICRKPHNNRFMICCDICEEWFHGKCVGITKAIGKQMEQDGLEWSCPNCTKKKKAEEHVKEAEKIKLLKEKLAQSIKDQQQKIKETQKLKSQGIVGKEKSNSNLKQTKISDFSQKVSGQWSEEEETVGRKCIMCKGPVRENSIYCSDDCIRKHSQHAISQLMADGNKKPSSGETSTNAQGESAKLLQKVRKEDPRIVVMDSNSKKFLKGQNAPTAANLTTWLKENPSYRVVYQKSEKPGKILLTSRKVVKIQSKPGEPQKVFQQTQKLPDSVKSTQLKLAISPNSKQINITQPSVSGTPGKKIYQIVTTTGPTGKQTTIKPKQTELVNAIPLSIKTIVPKGVPVKNKTPTVAKVVPATPSKDQPAVPTKKRKEKIQRQNSTSVPGKDPKMGQSTKPEEVKDKDKDKKDADQQIRESVKKSLAESLKARVQECKDMEYKEEDINELAVKIEEKLYKHFENKVDTKYKSKYRSLIFNIRDPKNETLFKKIVDNSITPKELVKLSPEELASQELARWREKENQHQLEIIKKTELELMTKGNTYIMKSHKGEQVIETDQRENVAAVAAEIDPNTPAQELVSALNSATSTAQTTNEEGEKSGDDSEGGSSKSKKKEKERRRSRDRKHDRRDKDRKRSNSSSRSRSHRSKDKKRSRSRDRDKEKSKYRHKDKKYDKKRERSSKDEGPDTEDSGDRKSEYTGDHKPEIKDEYKGEHSGETFEKNEITTSEPVEEKVFKKPIEEDDSDREPSSTVNIKTPDINLDEPEREPEYLWKGSIVMADVAKFSGAAVEISGDCSGLSVDIGDKVDIVGRIPFLTVWDYIARMKKMGTKDILVIKILPVAEDEKGSYETLYTYLSKRARIGVIGKTSEAVKDFYLYPLASHAPLPKVLLPLDGPKYEGDDENILLGIIVRNKHRGRHFRVSSTDNTQSHASKIVNEALPLPETVPDRSYTPPLPDKEQNRLLKKDKQKRKIRVRIGYGKDSANEEDELGEADDDSPYSPEDSDEDLPPLPKIAKPSVPSISSSISKLLSPSVPMAPDSNLQDPVEIQRKIEEMNRAIEEQTQQIQTLTSTVPKLAAGVIPTLPLLGNVTSSILAPPLPSTAPPVPTAVPAPVPPVAAIVPKPPPLESEKVQLPLISSETEEDSSVNPPRSFTPPLKTGESIPFLPGEVASKISLPSNLQEILNSIQKKTGPEESGSKESVKPVDEIMKTNSEIDKALNVLSQTKSLLTSLSTISTTKTESTEKDEKSSQPILRKMTDQELVQKAKEMEMTVAQESFSVVNPALQPAPCPPQPLPPGVQDIPLLTPDAFTNPAPPPFFSNPLISSAPLVDPSFIKSMGDTEDKKSKKFKLDPKAVFESEGVPDFVNIPGHSWDDKKGQKGKSYKIDIKLGVNTLEKKNIDTDHFDIESISKVSDFRDTSDRQMPSSSTGILPKPMDESVYDVDERILPKMDDKYRISHDRRRSSERDMKRDWKYDRRHRDDGRRYKDDYRRYDRRDRPMFRKDRFEDKRNRHLQKEWDGSIKSFEERQRRRNEEIRREEMRRSRQRADSSTN